MVKKIALACLIIVSVTMHAQDSLKVKIVPNNGYKWMMLYKLTGAKQQYVANTTVKDDEFNFEIPENSAPGMYRLFYDNENNGYFDIIYNKEPITVAFNPSSPEVSAEFALSEENKLYQSYLNSIGAQQSKLDSLQIANINAETPIKGIEKKYQKRLKQVTELQDYFEKEAAGKLVEEFIKTNRKYNSPQLVVSVDEYLNNLESHFFDYVDFNNEKLVNSSLFVDKSMEYVFYLNSSDDVETNQNLRKKSINELVEKIGDNNIIKSEILSSLLFALAGQEDLVLVDFVKKNHYNKLPEGLKSPKLLTTIKEMLKTAIGSVAPNFSLKEGDETKYLSQLTDAENYIVTFWSTTCSHCLKDIPQLYESTKDLENIKVIAIALEDDKFGFDHHTQDLTNWINVLGLKKWENEIARSYDVHSTPSYFVLDKDKKIIAKPEDLKDVQAIIKVEKKEDNKVEKEATKDE